MGSLLVAVVGALGAIVTAYFTAKHQAAREARQTQNDLTLRYAELVAADRDRAQALATQVAVGVLIIEGGPDGREKVFVPPNCRLKAGRAATNEIVIHDILVSKVHMAFSSDDVDVYVEDLGSNNGSYLMRAGTQDQQRVDGPTRLRSGDQVGYGGEISIEFKSLNSANR